MIGKRGGRDEEKRGETKTDLGPEAAHLHAHAPLIRSQHISLTHADASTPTTYHHAHHQYPGREPCSPAALLCTVCARGVCGGVAKFEGGRRWAGVVWRVPNIFTIFQGVGGYVERVGVGFLGMGGGGDSMRTQRWIGIDADRCNSCARCCFDRGLHDDNQCGLLGQLC